MKARVLAPHEAAFDPFEAPRGAWEAAERYESGDPLPAILQSDSSAAVWLLCSKADLPLVDRLTLEHGLGYAMYAEEVLARAQFVGDPDGLLALAAHYRNAKEVASIVNRERLSRYGFAPLSFVGL